MSVVPLRIRLVGVVVLLSALALTLSGCAASAALRTYLVGRVDDQLSSTVSRLVNDPHLQNNSGMDSTRVDPFSDAYAEMVTGDTIRSSTLRNGVSAPDLPSDLATRQTPFTVPALDGEHSWRVEVSASDDTLVVVALPLGGVEATMTRLIMLEIIGGGVVLILLAGVAYVVVRRSLRPLVQVESTAEQIAAGDLTQRLPEGHPRTEVGSLSRSFNTMVAQIETAFTAQAASQRQAHVSEQQMRRFVADASHELRTPLTSIRGFAELYRQGALPEGPDVDRAMSRIESESRRMGGLVDDLLLLARLDQRRPLDLASVDLVTLGLIAVEDLQVAAPDRRIGLQTQLSSCVVEGDAGRLAQVLNNLLTNALAHTGPETDVTLRIRMEDEQAVIEVADHGPGIPDADKARIFERFYRADASRTRASGGSGLGLAIVSELVHAHDGEVEVEDTPGGGATFRARFPLLERAQEQADHRTVA
jgi:two-component system OmpR family sensor kinase